MPEEPMTGCHFRAFVLFSAIRDFVNPPRNWVAEAGVKEGDAVLDFGCGRGGFTAAAARAAGSTGTVYALDLNPLALASARRLTRGPGCARVKTIRSSGPTGLQAASVDVILLYDVFHEFDDPEAILAELARVLKPSGVLSFSDHHLKAEDAIARVRAGGHFRFERKHKHTFTFVKK
jgi:ubiquinone/menaquinone biosynthesis C-methylase UbiE